MAQQLGFFVYRGTDDKPDFFCGWHFTGYGNASRGDHIPLWVSGSQPPHNTGDVVAPCLYKSELLAVEAAREIVAKTDNKRIEVMQVLGGYIRFDLT